jgi:diacylglycerol kinase family enzyme
VDREAAAIRWLRGMPLYSLAVLRTLARHFATPPVAVEFDDAHTQGPTLAVSVSLGVREGGFPLFRSARLDDGSFDTLHVGALHRWELLRYFPALVTGRIPANHPEIRTGRCRRAVIASDRPLCAHADGELICVPEDNVCEMAIELIPGRLRVESAPGR